MNLTKTLLYIIILFSLITGCKTARVAKDKAKMSSSSVENFDKFYNRFHTDSVFQMSRIVFPLGGMSVDGNGERKWDKKNWVLLKTRIYDVDTAQFKTTYKKTDKTFTQKAWLENSGLISECRFEIVNKKWHLVYFLDQNS